MPNDSWAKIAKRFKLFNENLDKYKMAKTHLS